MLRELIVAVGTIALTFTSCDSDDELNALDRAEVARTYIQTLGFDDLETFDLEPWLALLTEDATMFDPYGSEAIPPRAGKEEIGQFGRQFANFYQSNRFMVDNIFVKKGFIVKS